MSSQRFLLNFSKCLSIFRRHQSTTSPLEGIRILDLSRILAGPYCTMILGDLGAEIIKVERPGLGDDTRSWGPPFITREKGADNTEEDVRESCYFLSVNRNKKSVALDFKKPEGKQILIELAKKSDVLVENFVPGKLDGMGLGYSRLSEVAPQLIYCSITGFGSEGPYRSRAGYDVIAASLGGLMHITGPKDGAPCKVGVAMTDLATGLYAHGAIMASLLRRHKTGQGEHIQCNLLSTQVSGLVNLGSNYLNAGQEADRLGTEHASIVPYQSFKTKDGYFTVGCGNDRQFSEFCTILGRVDLSSDPAYARNEDRVRNRGALIAIITKELMEKTNKEWNEVFEGVGFPYGPVNNLESVFADPQVSFNGLVQTVDHPSLGTVRQVGPPVHFSGSRNQIRSAPPRLGQHTHNVLTELLGLDQKKLTGLREKKII